MTPEQRHEQLRGPENPRSRGHSPARDMREAAAEAAGDNVPKPDGEQQAASPAKVQVGKYEVSEDELAAMMDRQAQDDLRKATIPPTPADYKLQISPDAKLPGGVEFKFDASDPSLTAAKNWAHSKGLDQGAFSEMLTLYASHVAQQQAALAEVSRAEIAKAGVNAPQRVDAIGKWIRAEVGDADARPILATMVTDAHLRFFEKMQHRVTSQGGASFSQSHRVPADDKAIPGYAKMSFEQRRFAQDQRAAQRR
ncbi:hypothetical protein [Bradyrhizobium sp. LTSP857]|uniref:hypothetical protein n=1 Tax=Bradyrhizobium sp. LTSP857 TaxID=1619231 RepID=UPI0012E02D69|nr:hypothetical protein [Bradyrhizobium sp. LTSP857]